METSKFKPSTELRFNELVDYASEGIVSKRVIHKDTGNVSLFAFDRGQELSEHTAPFDALVQIIDGEGTIIINGKEYQLTAGTAIIMPANIPHAVKARKQFKMLLTMIKEK